MADKTITITRQGINPQGQNNITNLGISVAAAGGGGSVAWGAITGTLSSQSDLQTVLNTKVTNSANETISGTWSFTGGISGDVAFDTDTLYIDSGNNRVGFGTTSPAVQLHLNNATGEQLRLDDTSATGSPFMSFFQNGTRRSFIRHLDNGASPDQLQLWSEYGAFALYTGTGGSPTLSFFVDESGFIGNSASLSYELDITGDINTDSDYLLNGTSIFATANTWSAQQIFDRATQNIVLQGTSTGNANTPYLSFQDNVGTDIGYLGYNSGSDTNLYLVNETAGGRVVIGTNSTNRISIDETGLIGFGGAPTSYIATFYGDINLVSGSYFDGGVALPTASRAINAGAGLTGSGTLAADITIDLVNATNGGLAVGANDVKLDISNLDTSGTPTTTWILGADNGTATNQQVTIAEVIDLADLVFEKAIYLEFPTTADDKVVFMRTDRDITVSDVRSIVDAGSLTFNIAFGSSVASGVSVYTSSQTANNTTTGTSHNSGFNDATIPADNYVWLTIISSAGTVEKLNITFIATVD